MILLSLLLCTVSMQSCVTSSTQTTIEMNFYTNESGFNHYRVFDIVIDSSTNMYPIYSTAADQNIFITKINPDGTHVWSREYPGLLIKEKSFSTQVSSDQSTLRMLGDEQANP